jgi:hypothetical protein
LFGAVELVGPALKKNIEHFCAILSKFHWTVNLASGRDVE